MVMIKNIKNIEFESRINLLSTICGKYADYKLYYSDEYSAKAHSQTGQSCNFKFQSIANSRNLMSHKNIEIAHHTEPNNTNKH